MVKKLALTAVFLFAAGSASANSGGKESCSWQEVQFTIGTWSFDLPVWECTKAPPAVSAPEMDPTSAIAGLTLMLGSLAVLRGRRVKSPRA